LIQETKLQGPNGQGR